VYHPFMTTKLLLAFVLGLSLLPSTCSPARSPGSPAEIAPATAHSAVPAPAPVRVAAPAPSAPPPVDFQTQIRPILETRCQPCHFEGGKMYKPLPFDRPETIHKLGDKMFTRIKDPKEQEALRAFLAAR
jgi:hypothetical protein